MGRSPAGNSGAASDTGGSGELVQGTLDMLILRTLERGPNHGWGVAQHIQGVSEEVLRVEEGSLYPALHRLEVAADVKAEWGVSENNRRARIYQLTPRGRRRLAAILDPYGIWNIYPVRLYLFRLHQAQRFKVTVPNIMFKTANALTKRDYHASGYLSSLPVWGDAESILRKYSSIPIVKPRRTSPKKLNRDDLTVIYYTSNQELPKFEEKIRRSLWHNIRGLPLISVSQKPIDFGKNICVGEVGICGHNALRQMLIGAMEAKTKCRVYG